MHTIKFLLPLLMTLLLAVGCAGQAVKTPEGEGGAGAGGAQTGEPGSEGIPLGQDGSLAADPLNDPASPLSERVIYFDFDSTQIKPQYLDLLAAHGQYLAANAGTRITLEGHADERGTREYNVGLGERRAKAVEQVLLLQGASRDQLEIVSYGEELPVALGHDEASWEQNRRVELNYKR